jgi:hypothetical protein
MAADATFSFLCLFDRRALIVTRVREGRDPSPNQAKIAAESCSALSANTDSLGVKRDPAVQYVCAEARNTAPPAIRSALRPIRTGVRTSWKVRVVR